MSQRPLYSVRQVVWLFVVAILISVATVNTAQGSPPQLRSESLPDESLPPGFSVAPYLQNPSDTGMTIIWFTRTDAPATLRIPGVGQYSSEPVLAEALMYSTNEINYIHGPNNHGRIHADVPDGEAPPIPYKHVVRVEGLKPATTYDYTVRLSDSGATFSSNFTTAPATGARTGIRFVAMSDMETEPESTNKTVAWHASAQRVGGDKLGTDPDTYTRHYYIDQTTGYRANIQYAMGRNPDLWVIAGDLAEKGGRQLDWDEFWRHAAGQWSTFASTTPIIPAMGNHENYWHPNSGGYSTPAVMRAYDKWATYWDVPSNEASDERYEKRYYRLDYGPVTIITLDSSNGDDSDPAKDTNLSLNGIEARVPDFNVGSEQWQWAVRQLADAQAKGQIIFVQFHHMAYGTGVHSLISGRAGIANNEDSQSGRPMRIYHDLFKRYGVTAVISGHDEILEYVMLDGIHYWDVGFAGDGLRGPGYAPTTLYVPFDLLPEEAQQTHWSAHGDAQEIWVGEQLIDGGKHYGFLEVDVRPVGEYDYEVVMTPRYVFPLMNEEGNATGEFDFRQYDHVVRVRVER